MTRPNETGAEGQMPGMQKMVNSEKQGCKGPGAILSLPFSFPEAEVTDIFPGRSILFLKAFRKYFIS